MTSRKMLITWCKALGLVYLLLVAVGLVGGGFKLASGEKIDVLMQMAGSPLLGLLVGTIATALVQSSSTVTSIIVGLVAGGLPITTAIPLVMGANIGTTVTNTIVSLGHATDTDEFRPAFAAATVHDFFNLILVMVFLPLEVAFGFLQKMSTALVEMLGGVGVGAVSGINPLKAVLKPVTTTIKGVVLGLDLGAVPGGLIMIGLGIALVFIVIGSLGRILRKIFTGRAEELLHRSIGRSPVTGIVSGTVMTVLVQSSSTTTSLIVPLAGSGKLTLREVYPFTLGANIGTTITALLAACAVTGATAPVALQIAIVHLLFNALGVALVFGIPVLREIPLQAAENLAQRAAHNKWLALSYMAAVFFVIPGVLVLLINNL